MSAAAEDDADDCEDDDEDDEDEVASVHAASGRADKGTEAAQRGHHGKVFFRLSGRTHRRRRCSGRWGYRS